MHFNLLGKKKKKVELQRVFDVVWYLRGQFLQIPFLFFPFTNICTDTDIFGLLFFPEWSCYINLTLLL